MSFLRRPGGATPYAQSASLGNHTVRPFVLVPPDVPAGPSVPTCSAGTLVQPSAGNCCVHLLDAWRQEALGRVTQENQIKAQRIDELQQSIEAMHRNVEMIPEILARNPGIREVEAALQRKRRLATTGL